MILDPSGQPIGSPEEVVRRMVDELQTLTVPMEVAFQPPTVLQLVGLLQLVLRHPDISAEHRLTAWTFCDAAREYFADCPTLLSVLDAGDDPTQDVHAGGG